MSSRWPQFSVAEFTQWDNVPARFQQVLTAAGIPSGLFAPRYSASSDVEMVEIQGQGSWIRFGQTAGGSGRVYWDPSSGSVYEIASCAGASPILVNSSLDQFASTVRAVIAMFPFYGRNTDLADRTEVGNRVSAAIESIDPAASDVDGFWTSFVDDVINGDFATEDVLDPRWER